MASVTLKNVQKSFGAVRVLKDENGSAKVCHGSGGIVLLRAK
jgi:ABC-type sugar transport system ATPase subunit